MTTKYWAKSDLTLTKSKKEPKPVVSQGEEMKAQDGYTADDLKRLVREGWLTTEEPAKFGHPDTSEAATEPATTTDPVK